MSAREELRESLLPVDRRPAPGEAEDVDRLIDAYRAEVLREAAREFRAAAPLVFNGTEIALILEGLKTI